MIKNYFRIDFETDVESVKVAVDESLEKNIPGFIAVCDGNILSMVQKDEAYRSVIDNSMFAIMDSSWIPLYVKWKYGKKYRQYSGSDIFRDFTSSKQYRQYFLGSSQEVLDGLKKNLTSVDSRITGMVFEPLPYCSVDEFDYGGIAQRINDDNPDIIWLSLGAPKQEQFANELVRKLRRGVVIPVGAVFNFRSGGNVRRAPDWMVRMHLEFAYRLFVEPGKQFSRCWKILKTLPLILFKKYD